MKPKLTHPPLDPQTFIHGQEGTHMTCQKRLDTEGGKARCCICVPHQGCKYNPPSNQWEKEFRKKYHCDEIDCEDFIRYIHSLLVTQRKEIQKLQKEKREHRCPRDYYKSQGKVGEGLLSGI
jgi:hypothetical protein